MSIARNAQTLSALFSKVLERSTNFIHVRFEIACLISFVCFEACLARPTWHSDAGINCLLIFINFICIFSATRLWATGVEFLLLNVVGWWLSTNASPAGTKFLFRNGPHGQGR